MNINEVFNGLGIGDFKAVLSFDWDGSEKTWPGASLPFLSDKTINESCSITGLGADIAGYLISEVVPSVREHQSLSRLVWHLYHLLYTSSSAEKPSADKFPMTYTILGEKVWGLNLLLALAGIPPAMALHERLGIPKQISLDTFSDLAVWCAHFKKQKKITGISMRILNWMQNHLSGSLFRLGRLQFMHTRFKDRIAVYKNAATNEITTFIGSGIKLNSEGLYDGVDKFYDETGAWMTTLETSGQHLTGYPVSENGFVSGEKKTISLEEWKPALSPGDGVLDVHIPAIGPMTADACADSYRKAVEFFNKYSPEKDYRAFICTTWFFDPRLDRLLPENSNILRFRERYHLYPVAEEGGHRETISRVFGGVSEKTPLHEYPLDTTMQKNFFRYLQAGGMFRTGGGFFLKPVDERMGKRA